MKRLQIVPHNTNINFIGYRFVFFGIAALITLISLSGVFLKGLNYGIDFKGGYILEVRMPTAQNVTELREKLDQLKLGEITLQQTGSDHDFLVKVEHQHGGSDAQTAAIDSVKKTLGTGVDYRKIDTVGPKVGAELVSNAIKAITFSLIAMLLYIAFRFEWQFAICAIVALGHDCIAILGLFSVFPLEFNETAIIAVLITAGYSINDTIVIFDRIREGLRKYKRMEMGELINKSLNETLSRTTMTATTTLLAVTALYFFGGKIISAFSLPILFGILIGSFSSICLAAPLLMYLKINRNDVVTVKDKASLEKQAANH
ncbi:MAG: protein translocase subunit SecF [Candidatus Paracaedibacteraceae bacterium]|nr:protein translocase subunit SecF [Candidatus Paracaedibacteraceae bacterium]